jgi:GntR family transcriptional regulator, arabinose operon transcriptional repressor
MMLSVFELLEGKAMPATSDAKTPRSDQAHARRGASRRLAKVLREQFTSGRFGPGDKLPTHRQLMEEFKVGYSVANRAMELLAREGIIERQHGQGSYVTEKAAGKSRASQMDTLAFVLSYSGWSFNLSLLQGSDAAAGLLHYQAIVCETKNDIALQALALMQLIDRRVAGIALVPTTDPETPDFQVRVCQDYGIPVVLLHRAVKGVSAPLIALPYEEIGYRASKTLLEQGHRRVACVFDQHYVGTQQYEAGLRRGLEEYGEPRGLSVYASGRRPIPMTAEHERFLAEMLEGILSQPARRRPTAMVAIADDDAEWIYMHLMRTGVKVPQEMSLITVGSAIRRREIDRQFSAVTIDEMGVGRLAVRLLAEMGKRERPINDGEQFAADLGFHEGRTIGPAPQADG